MLDRAQSSMTADYAVMNSKPTGWAKLNGANAVSFIVVNHILANFDNFWKVNYQLIYTLSLDKNLHNA